VGSAEIVANCCVQKGRGLEFVEVDIGLVVASRRELVTHQVVVMTVLIPVVRDFDLGERKRGQTIGTHTGSHDGQ